MSKFRHKNGRFRSYENVFITYLVIGVLIILPLSTAYAMYQEMAEPVMYERTPSSTLQAPTTSLNIKVGDKIQYQEYARKQAKMNGVSVRWLNYLIDCETGGTWDSEIQSYVMQDYGREESYGLVQIHAPDNSSITYEQATDPYFSIDFAITETLKDNYSWRWKLCYKKYRNEYPL